MRSIKRPMVFYSLLAASLIILSPIGVLIIILAYILILTQPILLLIYITPAAFLYWVLLASIRKTLGHKSIEPNIWISGALAAGIMVAPPFFENRNSVQKISTLMAQDMDRLQPLANIESLGILVKTDAESDYARCEELCIRLLVNGEAEQVIIASAPNLVEPVDWTLPAISYSLESREGCPNDKTGHDLIPLDISGRRTTADRDLATETLRNSEVSGKCLSKTPANLGDAGVVLLYGDIANGKTAYGAGIDFYADTINAVRLSVFHKTENEYQLMYQKTVASYEKHIPVVAPVRLIKGNGDFNSRVGFLRTETLFGMPSGSVRLQMDATELLVGQMGLNLEIDEDSVRVTTTKLIEEFLDTPGRISRDSYPWINDFLSSLSGSELDADKILLIMRILEDRRIDTLDGSKLAVRSILKSTDGTHANQLAKVLFERLAETETGYNTPERNRL